MLSVAALALTLTPAPPQSRDVAEVIFSEIERRLICEFYESACPDAPDAPDPDPDGRGGQRGRADSKDKDKGGKGHQGLPPGLARRDTLPPGLQRQLDERGRLPPGLAKRALPDSLRQKLPGRGPEVEIVVVDRDVLLIQAATGLVYDAIAGIVRD
jgi:hypothetical protein